MEKTIAIIGGGPSASTLATLLARKGHKVGIFRTPQRPALIVGESLLPAIIPILKELGVEEKVSEFSVFKPGATICLDPHETLSFGFDLARTRMVYAYNVPRDKFDEAILVAAVDAGARLFSHRAEVKLDEKGKPVLTPETLAAAEGFFDDGIDLLVDASGRTRLLPNLLNLPSEEGGRKDLALFSHQENVDMTDPGNIHVDRYSKGWGWRIPLPGRVSVGIVVSPRHLKQLGDTKEEQYDNFLRQEPKLRDYVKNAQRTTTVMSYTNYQWKSLKLFGNGWALVGDSAGFIDPIFSTGLYLAMYSAVQLAKAIDKGTPAAFEAYQRQHREELRSWQTIIDMWYEGTLFSLFRVGQKYKTTLLSRFLNPFITKHVTRIFTGEIRSGSFSHKVLHFMTRYGLYKQDTSALVIN
ncbi:MAG: tryptophan 7-halogenase [Saprospiraceae bacterium]|nr:tryptophan 7-halogenase [Saprospiraceae bacterium]